MTIKSKWVKWQIGLVIIIILFYLFQEVKESQEFLAAVREASNSKLSASAIVTQKKTDSQSTEQFGRTPGDRIERRGRSRDQLNRTDDSFSQSQPVTQPQAQTHTRSHAS